jgi:glutamate dehydrogenase (NADP+)
MYKTEVLNQLKKHLCNEDFKSNEYYQAVEEVFDSLTPVLNDRHKENKILERLIVPEQVHKFKVIWEKDDGEIKINTGYRIQYNSSLGVLKGGLRFHPSVNEKILKFLAFEQTFKNSLTGLMISGAKGGADIDPKTMSNSEMRRFCYAFATQLNRYIGDRTDVPAGDIGVGGRELGYIYGKLKELRNKSEFGIISGKPVDMGGSLARTEATGYGVVYFLINMLEKYGRIDNNYFPKRDENYVENLKHNQPLQGKRVVISGSGNVAIYAAEKVIQLGGKVIAMSDSSGTLIDELKGIDLNRIKDIKEVQKGRLIDYTKDNLDSVYIKKEDYKSGQHKIWDLEGTDIALPCATQNELNLNDIRNLYRHNDKIVILEGANMPTTASAMEFIFEHDILFAPGKASNAGGVATSFLEMSQNSSLESWRFAKVEQKIEEIMYGIFINSYNTAKEQGNEKNLVMGANIYSFNRLVDSMINQGLIS